MGNRRRTNTIISESEQEDDNISLYEREERCIDLAMDLAERQLREGTASAQVITQFLKWGSARERLEQENKELENQLLEAKTEAIRSAQHAEELYINAINAMRSYVGSDD